MPSNPIIKTSLSFTELMAHWKCSENDLRDAIVTGRLVPSVYVKGAVWELVLDTSAKRKTQTSAVSVNELMYLVEVERLGVSDCAFKYFSRETHLRGAGSLFKPDASAYVDVRKRLSDIEKDGRFTVDSIAEAEASYGNQTLTQSSVASITKTQWWNSDHDVWAIAKEIEKTALEKGWGVNQSGARAQRYPISTISEAVAKQIEDREKATGRGFSIGGKTISNFLKKAGWN